MSNPRVTIADLVGGTLALLGAVLVPHSLHTNTISLSLFVQKFGIKNLAVYEDRPLVPSEV